MLEAIERLVPEIVGAVARPVGVRVVGLLCILPVRPVAGDEEQRNNCKG